MLALLLVLLFISSFIFLFSFFFLVFFTEMRLLQVYLALFNEFQGLGWLYILVSVFLHGFTNCWDRLGSVLLVLQLFCVVDVAHALLGLWGDDNGLSMAQRLWCKVPRSVCIVFLLNFIQVGHRGEIFLSIFLASASLLNSDAFGFLLFTWALADIARFQLYALRSLGVVKVPFWLKYLRYTDFLVQYPLVVFSEALFVGFVASFRGQVCFENLCFKTCAFP